MSFDPKDPVNGVIAGLIGRPAWGVKAGYGGNLTLEFGEPHLDVREPYVSNSRNEGIRRRAAQRVVTVHGDWHLWIRSDVWSSKQNGVVVARIESADADIAKAAAELDGQILSSFEIDRATASCRFTFDLGGELLTGRSAGGDARETEEWLLFEPCGNVLTLRADASYSWSPSDTRPEDELWLPL